MPVAIESSTQRQHGAGSNSSWTSIPWLRAVVLGRLIKSLPPRYRCRNPQQLVSRRGWVAKQAIPKKYPRQLGGINGSGTHLIRDVVKIVTDYPGQKFFVERMGGEKWSQSRTILQAITFENHATFSKNPTKRVNVRDDAPLTR